ncbi:MAG: beta strand repeat-containing protein, partial [Ferruginibacter sp.]
MAIFCAQVLSAQNVQTITTTGSWVAPSGVTSITVECWGGGGAGGGVSGSNAAGGGGSGGAYARNTIIVVPGNTYTVTVGAGGVQNNGAAGGDGQPSWFNTTGTILAVGGKGGPVASSNNSGSLGAVKISTGNTASSTNFYGGKGGDAASNGTSSGAGGGSAGSASDGNPGTGATPGLVVTNGAIGATGLALTSGNGGDGNPGNVPGSGGSGGQARNSSDRRGGRGGAGQVRITWSCTGTLPYSNGFNNTTLALECWRSAIVSGSGSNISLVTSGTNPTTSPNSGTRMIQYNSFSAPTGSEERLISPSINTTGTNFVDVEFYWRNENNTSYNAGTYLTEGVQIQYSLDGTNWVNAGAFIPRHDGSLASGTAAWNLKTVNLPIAAGNQASVLVAFKFYSAFGDNQFLDNVTIKAAPACSGTPAPGNTIASPSSICTSQTLNLSLQNSLNQNGLTFQWQSAPDVAGAPGTWTNIGTSLPTYSATVSTAAWYRCRVTCSGNTGNSTPVYVAVNAPTLLTTTPATICGPKTATLAATVGGGATAKWYTTSTGGLPVGTGNSFTTPVLSASTTYYVAAEVANTPASIAIGTATTSNGTTSYPAPYTNYYGGNKHQFLIRASELTAAGMLPGQINSLSFIVTGVGSAFSGTLTDFRIDMKSTSSTTLNGVTFETGMTGSSTMVYSNAAQTIPTSGFPATVTHTFSTPFVWDGTSNVVVQTLYSNANTGNSNTYVQMQQTDAGFTATNLAAGDGGYPAAAFLNITDAGGSSTLRSNMIFGYTPICATARTAVAVTYTSPAALTVNSNSITTCNGTPASVNVTSTLSNYTTYSWSPSTGVTTSGTPNGTTASINASTTAVYTLTATGGSGGCSNQALVTITVNPQPPTPNTTGGITICQGQSIGAGLGLTASVQVPITSFSGNVVAGPTFARSAQGTTYTAESPGSAVYYHLQTFNVTTTGTYTFTGCGTPSSFDVFGSIYQTTFNPASPATNFLIANDDGNAAGCNPWGALVSRNLTAGVNYVFVTSSYWNGETGAFNWVIAGPGNVLSGAISTLRWYTAETGGTSFSSASPLNPIGMAGSGIANSNTPGVYSIYAATYNGTCESVRTPVDLTILAYSVAATGVSASLPSVCSSGAVTLTQTGGVLGAGATWRWYTEPACTNLVGSSTAANASLVVNPTTATTYYVRAEGGT